MQETQKTQVQSLGQEDPLEEGMATHTKILARKVSWTEDLGGLQFMGCKKLDKSEHTVHMHSVKRTQDNLSAHNEYFVPRHR